MELKGHLLYYPEGKHDINLDNYIQKSQLNDALKSKVDPITKTTYADLKNLRDNSKLVPGAFYRITDYQCTTTQENTQSAGHQFDIVLLALSENKLAEEGWAMMHDNIYDVTFSDGVTKRCYIYNASNGMCYLVDIYTLLGDDSQVIDDTLIINAENKTATCDSASTILDVENLPYNYFQNSNLSAWKIWYCLDNDTERFGWADDSVDEGSPESITLNDTKTYARDTTKDTIISNKNYYGWTNDATTYYTRKVNDLNNHTSLYVKDGAIMDDAPLELMISSYNPPTQGTGLPNGRGVIYRLIDEWNNDVGYDFKNIQFVRKLTDGELDTSNGTDTWVYTLNVWYNDACEDASIVGNTLVDDTPMVRGVAFNKINENVSDGGSTQKLQVCLNDIVFLTNEESGIYAGTSSNNCLHSNHSTIIWSDGIDIEFCSGLTVKSSQNSKFYICSGNYEDTVYSLYLNNKKVLTES